MSDTSVSCSCGHSRAAHEHYRKGSDCGACGPVVCRTFSAAKLVVSVPTTERPTPVAV